MLSLRLPNFAALYSPPINSFYQVDLRCSLKNGFCSFSNINGGNPLTSPRTSLAQKRWNPNAQTLESSPDSSKEEGDDDDTNEEEDYLVLSSVRSYYNEIMIVDTPKSRMLLLDSSHNVHSILYKHQKWTGSYWDEFASLPAIIPNGPVAIFGLGGGTAAHLMLDVWPSLQLEGWEIDEILIEKAKNYFGLSNLEKCNQAGGRLEIRIGDALNPSIKDCGRYAGIIVDLFSEGMVLEQLQEVATWLELNDRLMPNGRLMVNCGGINAESGFINGEILPQSFDGIWVQNSTIKALSKAFPGKLNWKRMPETEGANFMALTGPLPDLDSWSVMVPDRLSENVKKWKSCCPLL